MASPVWYRVLLGILLLSVVGWCLYRDIQIEKLQRLDLPNRIAGARLEKDGISPYFYSWKSTDGLRYLGSHPNPNGHATNITASPFFHHLMAPIAELSHRTISRIWLITTYLMLLLCIVIALTLTTNTTQRWVVIVTSVLFLLTDAWERHIDTGQIYMIVPVLALLFYYCINKTRWLYGAVAGLVAITLVLIRPNALLFLLPFLVIIRHYRTRYLVAFIFPVVCLLGWSFGNQQERQFWQDYKKSISAHIKGHQDFSIAQHPRMPPPENAHVEGPKRKATIDDPNSFRSSIHSENGNFFVLVYKTFHTKIPVALLNILAITIVILLFTAFLIKAKKQSELLHPVHIALLGYCLFMISDLFSPIHRHQYYGVQWLFPLLLASSLFTTKLRWVYFFIGLGLVLNIVNIGFIKMEHTIGEYMMLGAFLWMVFRSLPVEKGEEGVHVQRADLRR